METRTCCGRLALLVTALAFKTSVSAMVVLPAEFNEMVAASQTIVHGRVVDVRSYETAGRMTIESLVTVQVLDAIKGQGPLGPADAGRYVYFKVPGGQVGRYRRIMVGAPQCERGDELVLFLKGSAPAVPMPFGLTQGVYRVNRDTTGQATVMPNVNAGGDRVLRGDPSRRPLALATFINLVRTIASSRP
jgi:hypothetical protein